MIPKINSAHGSDTRNILNRAIDLINVQGKSIQDLVAEGQLAPGQYADLINTVNGMLKSGEVGENDLTPELRSEVDKVRNKIDKGEVSVDDIDKNKGKLDQTYLTQDLIDAITGAPGANILSEVADGAVTRIKLANKAASPEKTNFIKVPNNLINKRDVIENKTIDTSTGQLVDDPNYVVTDFIPTEFETSYTRKNTSRFFSYRPDKTFLSSSTLTTYETAVNGAYFRFSIAKADLNTAQVNRGTQLQEYDEYVFEIGDGKKQPFSMKLNEMSVGKKELQDNSITPEKTTFINQTNNLFNRDVVLEGTSMTDTGEVVEDSNYWLGNLIPTSIEEVFSITPGSYRIFYYDKDGEFYTRSGINTHDTKMFTTIRDAAIGYFRLSGSTLNDYKNVVVNKGDVLHEWDEFQRYKLDQDLIDYKTPSGGQPIDEEKLENEVMRLMDHPSPSIPSLDFKTVRTGWDFITSLSRDGEVVYGSMGRQLLQSKDEFETLEEVGEPLPAPTGRGIAAIRELYDGELLLSIQRNEDENERGKVYKTVGYDRDNPTDTTFKQVLELNVDLANIQNNWGMSVYNNIVLVSEYGLRGEQGARFVYLSEDHGNTFTPIFDQMTTTAEIENAPEWTESGHLHTVEYDPYWNRIWLVVGDNPNSATYYSDDMGENWIFVEGSTVVQYTGIKALPDVVIFGSDRNPNGVHHFVRKNKSDMPVIKPLLLLNDEEYITHVFQKAFKRDWHPKTPTYFASTAIRSTGEKSVIIGTVNGKRAFTLWESGNNFDGNVSIALGPTKQGNILTQISEDGLNGRRIAKAPAPDWE